MIKLLDKLAGISDASRRQCSFWRSRIGRQTAGLVQNGMVTAVATEIFLKQQGEILQSVRGHTGAPPPPSQICFFSGTGVSPVCFRTCANHELTGGTPVPLPMP